MTTVATPLSNPKAGPSGAVSEALPAAPHPVRIRRHVTDTEICVLTFDRPDAGVNLFDRATLRELDEHLNAISNDPGLKGVVLISAKKSVFIAGADIHALAEAVRPEDVRELIELGQSVFSRIAALSVPTLAAIHGACVGGGYEICLACDYRVASSDRSTKIGLPEVQLGILPAWGGCTRLPRLIGLPKALDIILAGKTVAARQALKLGLVDDLVHPEYLADYALQKIAANGLKLRRRPTAWTKLALNNPLLARILKKRLHPLLLKKTRGHYPAVMKALDVITAGISKSVEDSLELELEAVLELAQSDVCHNLVRVFFLQERAKKPAATPAEETPPISRLAVIGAGVMGAGIAQWASARELPVILRDISTEQVAKGLASVTHLYEQGVKRHVFTRQEARAGLDRIFPATQDAPLRTVDLVIEAAVEKMELKKKLFAELEQMAGPNTILATNTSALSITEIAGATQHPERVLGIHFFNPVHRMSLVEVVVGRHTSAQVVNRAVRFVQQIGKLPVVVKDSPGFLVNRILMPYLVEAGILFQSGARVEDIDEAMLEFGMPMGPLRLIDEVGLDVCVHVAETLAAKYSKRMQVPPVLGRMLAAGLLGRKNGQGFYAHSAGGGKEPGVNPHIDNYHQETAAAGLSRAELQNRMVLLMLNEAARCVEEEIVTQPSDVDFGMILGTGFAPFLGGPLRFADFVGIPKLVEEMHRLAGKGLFRFAPCMLMQMMAKNGKTFYDEKGSRHEHP